MAQSQNRVKPAVTGWLAAAAVSVAPQKLVRLVVSGDPRTPVNVSGVPRPAV